MKQNVKDVIALIREKYSTLSKSHQALAGFIMNNPQDSAFLSINALSQKTDISPATITRFVRAIGFSGYPEFQRSLFEDNQAKQAPFQSLKTALRGLETEKQDAQSPISTCVSENIGLLQELYQPQMQETINKAAAILRKAKRIYVIGNGSSYAISYLLGFMLHRMYSNVHLLERSTDALHASALCDIEEGDCLIASAYSRYTKITCDTVSFFRKKGCDIISITDSLSSPIALVSNEVLLAPRDAYFSPVSATALCSCLIAALAQYDAQQMLERMERQDQIAADYGVYL